METINQNKAVGILRILYPIWVLVGIFSIMYVPSQLIEFNDAIVTAKNISNNSILYRFGIFGSLLTQILFIIIPLLLYKLFEKVDKFQSILMVVLALVSVPISMYNDSNKLMVLKLLDKPELLLRSLETYSEVMIISMIFWGLWLFPLGILVFKSGYFPKFIGYFLIVGGFGYLFGAFTEILFPNATLLLSTFEIFTFGEIIFILWLTIKGAKLG